MTATINSNAGGVWVGEEGTRVTVLESSPNGRASLVRLPQDVQRLHHHAGRKCWIPTSWVDEEVADRA